MDDAQVRIGMKTDPTTTAGRVFVRSLNILLKFARLYGYDHVRTTEQLKVAWEELSTAIPEGSEGGLLLGATGAQLLLELGGLPQPSNISNRSRRQSRVALMK